MKYNRKVVRRVINRIKVKFMSHATASNPLIISQQNYPLRHKLTYTQKKSSRAKTLRNAI